MEWKSHCEINAFCSSVDFKPVLWAPPTLHIFCVSSSITPDSTHQLISRDSKTWNGCQIWETYKMCSVGVLGGLGLKTTLVHAGYNYWHPIIATSFSQDTALSFCYNAWEFGEHLIRYQKPFLHIESLQTL